MGGAGQTAPAALERGASGRCGHAAYGGASRGEHARYRGRRVHRLSCRPRLGRARRNRDRHRQPAAEPQSGADGKPPRRPGRAPRVPLRAARRRRRRGGVARLFAASRGIRTIVHLAAQAGVRYSAINPDGLHAQQPRRAARHDRGGAPARGLEDFVYASTSSVYGGTARRCRSRSRTRSTSRVSLYGATKSGGR